MEPSAILLAPTDGGLAMARSLRKRGVAVHIVGEPSWVMRTRWAERHPVGQLPAERRSWLEALDEVAARGDGVLFPGTDRVCAFVAAERQGIPARLRSFESGESAHRTLIDKAALHELAAEADVRAPWTIRARDRDELDAAVRRARYPCLLKPAVTHHWRRLIGERRAIVVDNAESLAAEAEVGLEAGLELLVTEFVPGPDRNLEGAVTVRAADGSYPLTYAIRKLRSYPPGSGTGSAHESADLPEAVGLARRLLDAAGFEGVANVEFKRHAENGELVLIDVNPRLPQCWGLADACGTDGSWRLYSTLAGLPLGPQPRTQLGVRSLAPSLEPKAVVANLAEGRLTLRELLTSYRGVRDVSGLSILDPGPVLTLTGRQVRSLGRRLRPRK